MKLVVNLDKYVRVALSRPESRKALADKRNARRFLAFAANEVLHYAVAEDISGYSLLLSHMPFKIQRIEDQDSAFFLAVDFGEALLDGKNPPIGETRADYEAWLEQDRGGDEVVDTAEFDIGGRRFGLRDYNNDRARLIEAVAARAERLAAGGE